MPALALRLGVPGAAAVVPALSILPLAMQANPPDVFLNLKTNQAFVKSTSSIVPASSLVSVSRASAATQQDSNGNFSQVAANTLAQSNLGAAIWESRTNAIRNNTMQGAVVQADNVELTTNGNFAAQGSGWTVSTAGAGSVVFGTGSVTITGDGSTSNNFISQLVTGLVVGRSYVASVTGSGLINIFVGTTAGSNNIANVGGGALQGNGNGTSNADRGAFTATQSTAWVTLEKTAAVPAVINSVSVQDGQRVENGTFTFNPINAAQSTVQNGWEWTNNAGTGTVVYNGAGSGVTITGDGTHISALGTAGIPTVAGFTYTITATISGTAPAVVVTTGALGSGSVLLNVAGTLGTASYQFTATSSTSFLSFQKTPAASSTINNVSVQSAGALPTNNWSVFSANGVITSVVAIGTQNGINTIDLNFSGTPTTTFYVLAFDSAVAAATYGQTWTSSVFAALVGGSLTNISSAAIEIRPNAGGVIDGTFTPTSTLTRQSVSGTPPNSALTGINGTFLLNVTNGSPINATIRLGWPQLENNSTIPSTVASAAIAAGGTGGTAGTAVYSIGGGTLASGSAATLNVTVSGGAITAINSVASAGSYSVFPPSPAPLTFVSGTGTGVTGATVTLTPTNNAVQAAASNPILTSGSAATKNSDSVSATLASLGLSLGASWSFYAKANPQLPTAAGAVQSAFELTDGGANRVALRRSSGSALCSGAGGTQGFATAPGFAQGADGKLAAAFTSGNNSFAFDGTMVTAGNAGTAPVGMTELSIGSTNLGGAFSWDGNVEEVAFWATQRVPDAFLQSITT